MIGVGVKGEDLAHLIRTLFNHHQIRVRVHTTTLDGDVDVDLTDRVLDGQVDIDGTADVTRTASLTLLDAHHSLDLDSDSANDLAMFLDRMIVIHYDVKIDYGHGDGWEWQPIPIFTGPITTLSRTGPEVSVEASGKEALSYGAVWRTLTIRKGRTKAAAIRILLRERAGETRFDIPNLGPRLPKALSLDREDIIWTRAKSIARSIDRQLFYDGRGVCTLRRHPARPHITFGPDTMLSPAQVDYTQDDVVNAVFVKGGIPRHGGKVQIAATFFAPRTHPLSPWRLGRNGVPRYLMDTIEDNHIRSYAEARRHARTRIRQGLAQGVQASFDVLPMPLLEPGDMVRAVTDDGTVTFRVQTFSIPLVAGNPMTLGYNKHLRRPVGRLHHRYRTAEWHGEMLTRRHHIEQAALKHKKEQVEAYKRKVTHKKGAPTPITHHTGKRTPHTRKHKTSR